MSGPTRLRTLIGHLTGQKKAKWKNCCNFIKNEYFSMRFFSKNSTRAETHESGLGHDDGGQMSEWHAIELSQVDHPENKNRKNQVWIEK